MNLYDIGKWKTESSKSSAGRWGLSDPGHFDPGHVDPSDI